MILESIGNWDFAQVGTLNERGDLSVHVCPVVKRVYVYLTVRGIEAIKTGAHKMVEVKLEGRVTGKGYLVPSDAIEDCWTVILQPKVWRTLNISESDSLVEREHKADRLVMAMLKAGQLPVPITVKETPDRDCQMQGGDGAIVVESVPGTVIHVKCDFEGGEKSLGGTGNLFL